MAVLTPGESVFVGDYADAGDATVQAGSASSGWQVWDSYTFVPSATFALTPGEAVFVGDYADKDDETVKAHEADSGWKIWGDYVFMGEFPTNKPCPDVWAVIG
jgi:hypothetical protein